MRLPKSVLLLVFLSSVLAIALYAQRGDGRGGHTGGGGHVGGGGHPGAGGYHGGGSRGYYTGYYGGYFGGRYGYYGGRYYWPNFYFGFGLGYPYYGYYPYYYGYPYYGYGPYYGDYLLDAPSFLIDLRDAIHVVFGQGFVVGHRFKVLVLAALRSSRHF